MSMGVSVGAPTLKGSSMSVSSVGTSPSAMATQSLQRSPEASEVKQAGGDHDGDSDDSGIKAVASKPVPTVNGRGQSIGRLVSTTA